MTGSGLDAAHEFMPVVMINTNFSEQLYFSRWSEFSAVEVDKTNLALLVSQVCRLHTFFQRGVFLSSALCLASHQMMKLILQGDNSFYTSSGEALCLAGKS